MTAVVTDLKDGLVLIGVPLVRVAENFSVESRVEEVGQDVFVGVAEGGRDV